MQANLSAATAQGLNVRLHPEPGLIGGLRIQVGSDVFDGSVQARLAGWKPVSRKPVCIIPMTTSYESTYCRKLKAKSPGSRPRR